MNKIAHFIIHSKAAAYIAALLYIVVWCSRSVQVGGIGFSDCLGLLLSLVMGYLSVRVAREFSLNDIKNVLPATLFFMGCAIAPQMGPVHGDGIHLALFAVVCYILLRTYRSHNAMGSYFCAFALIGIQCLMEPSLLLTLPWLVLCGVFMESLHVRTFFAALWGLLFPYWIMGGMLFLTDRVETIAPYFDQILPLANGELALPVALQLWMQQLWVLLLILPGSVMILFNRSMKLQASAGLRLLMLSLVVLLVAIWIFPVSYSALYPCVLLCSSLVGTAFFTMHANRVKNIYLVVLLILWILSLALYVWSNCIMY